MFARKIRVLYIDSAQQKKACPLKWLDNFCMRNVADAGVFDNTLPLADGQMEIGSNVPLDKLAVAIEDWFHRQSYLAKDSKLSLEEMGRQTETKVSVLKESPYREPGNTVSAQLRWTGNRPSLSNREIVICC